MADALLEGFVSLIVPSSTVTNLCEFAAKGDVKKARKAMGRGIAYSAKDEKGQTALHVAVTENQEAFVRWLVEDCHADVNCTENQHLYSPLHSAVIHDRTALWKYLLSKGADPHKEAKRDGETPYDLVKGKGNNRVIAEFEAAMEASQDARAELLSPRGPPAVSAGRPTGPARSDSSVATLVDPGSRVGTRLAPATVDRLIESSQTVAELAILYRKQALSDEAVEYQRTLVKLDKESQKFRVIVKTLSPSFAKGDRDRVSESLDVVEKACIALGAVGRKVIADPANKKGRRYLMQVLEILVKHLDTLETVARKNREATIKR
uniref:Uncharacterized protein n=1 Tax=Sexangularia sp. CB-2014 TaxID=1486929 RepID=A0A7S1VS42_9EUKA